ncbi:metallopeptidase family m24 domain-containing protein [Ditylenchus destructor]|nr:metallopeptidase family m24 domain-containing protein [Ditylenchus destructor]
MSTDAPETVPEAPVPIVECTPSEEPVNTTPSEETPENSSPTSLLRALFQDPGRLGTDEPIQAYVLPRTDAHQSEYLAESDCRVKFLSGFSGSNAYCVITETSALLWTDPRYYVQAHKELHPGWTRMDWREAKAIEPLDWIVENLPAETSVGFDPHLFGLVEGKNFVEKLRSFNLKPVPISKHNLVDLIWTNRPVEVPKKIICLLPSECGEDSKSKVERVREKMRKAKCDVIILTLLDDIAWLFNIRGSDIPYNPLVFSVAAITLNDVFLFIDEQKISSDVAQHLAHVNIFSYTSAAEFLEKYHMWLPDSVNYCLGSLVEEKFVYTSGSPVQPMKAVKNEVELAGMRNSHVRDSAALVQFLVWFRRELELGHLVDESRAAKQMDYYRSKLPLHISQSFTTISASEENSALPHYNPTDESGKKHVTKNSVYLLDSGGQYRDGTTDVTRTIYYGGEDGLQFADEHIRKMFTLVLKGHINCAMACFPENIHGIRLEMLARQPLWQEGYDFGHGVGHGVGHFLNVHEGPIGISFKKYNADGLLKKGMVLTIEPGYYEEGRFGIRIENCYELVSAGPLPSGAKDYLTFSPLTLVPIQKSLIMKDLLEPKHIHWLNAYHNRCLEVVGKYLQEQGLQEEYNYLAEACLPF